MKIITFLVELLSKSTRNGMEGSQKLARNEVEGF